MSEKKLSIKDWSEDDQPREKLIEKGRAAVSDAELFAILIGSGNKTMNAVELSRCILNKVKGDINALALWSVANFKKFNGIGDAKAVTIVAALELGRRRKELTPTKRKKVDSAMLAHQELYAHFADLKHEEFWILLLNRASILISKHRISTGGTSATVVDAKILFKLAIEQSADALIMAHNHPSGNLLPSPQDLALTQRIKMAAQTFDINLLDHLIIAGDDHYSFKKEGLLG